MTENFIQGVKAGRGIDLAFQTPGSGDSSWLLEGATMWLNGQQINGAMPNKGAWSQTVNPSASAQSVMIPYGYHNGSGKVVINAIPASAKNCQTIHAEVAMKGMNDPIEKYSAVKDTGNNNRKGVFACGTNMRVVTVQGSNDNSTWVDIVTGSCNGSSSGDNGTPFVIYSSNVMYRYYRLYFAGYNNGGNNIATWGIFTS